MIDATLPPDDTNPVPSTAPAPTAVRCANCGTDGLGRYCHACGERRLDPARDHSLLWFLEQTLAGFTSFDSKLLRTFAALLFRPGRLTREHLDGRRVRYMAPLQVFFVTSVLFYCFFERAYAAPIASLQSAYDRGVWLGNVLRYDIVGALIAKAAATHQDVDVLAMHVFERAGQESKLFLGVLMPFLGVVLHLLFWRRQPRFVPHLVAAVHSFSLFLLLDLAFLFVCRLLGMNQISDWAFLPLFSIYATYLFVGLRRIYGVRAFEALWKSLAMVASLVALILVYRQVVTVVVAEFA